MATQSIIVYRNPAEQALWESGAVFPVMIGCVVGMVSFLLAYNLLSWVAIKVRRGPSRAQPWRGQSNQIVTYIAGAIGTVAGFSTVFYML